MFGYVRAFKPYLRVCEYDTYRAIYCGLCKEMGRLTGQASRLTLSYDVTFLAMLGMAVNEIPVKARRERCPVHPINKSLCVYYNKGLEYPAFVSMILTYYKLSDNKADGKAYEALLSKGAMAGFKNGYKKAAAKYPELDREISDCMKLQLEYERGKETLLDKACDPTARMMSAVMERLTEDSDKKQILSRFGYALGRFIYVTDALDDLRKDIKTGGYNPLALTKGIEISEGKLSKDDYKKILKITDESINLSLAELADSFMALDVKMYRATLDNIIYVGLPDVYRLVKSGKFNKRKKDKGEDKL